MSVDFSSIGDVQAYWIHASLVVLVPLAVSPQFPQPWPVPGAELVGVVGWLTLVWFSHDAVPLVVMVAEAPNSAEVSFSLSATVISFSVRSSPSVAQNRNV